MCKKLTIDTKIKTIGSLITEVKQGLVCVPPFQRDFVWTCDNIKDLFDSIKKNYPIGSLLLWKPSEKMNWEESRKVGPFELPQNNDQKWYVLDGFQRLSSMFGCLTNPDKSSFACDEQMYKSLFNLYYDLKNEEFFYPRNDVMKQPYQVPLHVLLSSSDFRQYSRTNIEPKIPKDEIDNLLDRADSLASRFIEYKIACIEINDANIEEAVEIFSRLNSKGVDISFDWMVNALSYKKNNFKFSDEITKTQRDLKEFGFEKTSRNVLFRCIQSSFGKLYFDQTDIEHLAQRDDFAKTTRETIPFIKKAVQFLHNELHVNKYKYLPYNMQLIFIMEFFRKISNPSEKQINDLKNWFWKTSYSNYFTVNSLTYQRKAYNQFIDYACGASSEIFYDDGEKNPYTTYAFPKKISLGAVRSKALILFLKTDNPNLQDEQYSDYIENHKNEIMLAEMSFVESLGLRYFERNNLVHMPKESNSSQQNKLPIFVNTNSEDSIILDYTLNNGSFIIGNGKKAFDTRWSECGDDSIYCYRDGVKSLFFNPDIVDFPQYQNIPEAFNFTSRCKSLVAGNVIILENSNGYFCAIKIIKITNNKKDLSERHHVEFRYHIYDSEKDNIDNIIKSIDSAANSIIEKLATPYYRKESFLLEKKIRFLEEQLAYHSKEFDAVYAKIINSVLDHMAYFIQKANIANALAEQNLKLQNNSLDEAIAKKQFALKLTNENELSKIINECIQHRNEWEKIKNLKS